MKPASVAIFNRQRAHRVDAAGVRRFLGKLADELGIADAAFSVVFLTDAKIQEYNRKYRGYDKPTDVLSFEGHEGYLGDILISVETAYHQARRSPLLTLDSNISRLLLHGMLHLLGYDHAVDNGQMRSIERRLRRRFGC